MRGFFSVLLVILFFFSLAPLFSQPTSSGGSDKIELTIVKLAGLEKAIKSHQGKVVLVYLWGDYSIPDLKRMVDVVKMEKRLGKAPIVFITVCHSPVDRDDPKQFEKNRVSNLEFLKKVRARFQNFVLDEDDEVWAAKLGFVSGPTFNVHAKSGKRVKTFSPADREYSLGEVEGILKDLASGKLSGK